MTKLKQFYQNLKRLKSHLPYHGGGVLIWRVDKKGGLEVLLGLRKYNPQRGQWSIPAGGWDEKQDRFTRENKPNYQATAIRETWEEIGLTIDDKDVAPLWHRHLPYFHFEVFAYNITDTAQYEVRQEFSELTWHSVDSLPNNTVGFVKAQVSSLKRKLKL